MCGVSSSSTRVWFIGLMPCITCTKTLFALAQVASGSLGFLLLLLFFWGGGRNNSQLYAIWGRATLQVVLFRPSDRKRDTTFKIFASLLALNGVQRLRDGC